MIGNDIIDLKLASTQSNWKRKGFLDKIFTKEELSAILSSSNPFQIVWLFWSMKESVYKAYVQKYQKRFFAPKKIKCKLISKTEGIVVIDDKNYHTNSNIYNDFIFTEAALTSSTKLISNYVELKNTSHTYQSEKIYKELKAEVSRNLNILITELQLKKKTLGIPKLYRNNKQLEVPFSLSHHGKYGAYSFLNEL